MEEEPEGIRCNVLKFLVSAEQMQRIKQNATIKGYTTLSAYLRDVALNKDSIQERLIWEIHKEVIKHGKEERRIES